MRFYWGIVVAVLFASINADASKSVQLPETAKVGRTEGIHLVPNLKQEARLLSAKNNSSEKTWRREIRKNGANFLRLHFTNFNLRPGDVLIVRSKTGRIVERLKRQGPKSRRSFWGLSAFGDKIDLELRYKKPYDRAPFEVDQVVVGKVDLNKFRKQVDYEFKPLSLCGESNMRDVKCDQTNGGRWRNVMASVGVMKAGGSAEEALFCSGSNVSPNNYVLTNAHCIETQAECDNAEFVFQYFRNGCGTTAETSEWVSYRCGELVATSPYGDCDTSPSALDFSLNKIDGDPASQFGYAQVATEPVQTGEEIYIVQHPRGRPHEIADGRGSSVQVDEHVLRYYDSLDTEPGSSGSPIYRESDHSIVGLHHCGGCSTPGVGNRGALMTDIYPRIKEFLCRAGIDLKPGMVADAEEVRGNGDDVMDPGETWQFTPTLKNNSCDTAAKDIKAIFELSSGTQFITLLTPVISFGDAEPGKPAIAEGPVQFKIEKEFPCGKSFAIDLQSIHVGGTPTSTSVEKYFQGQVGEEVFVNVAFENFSNGLPQDWIIEDRGTGSGPAQTWTADNPGNRNLLNAPFLIVDSDHHGKDQEMDETVAMPARDMSEYSSVTLQFAHAFKRYKDEKADVDIRSSATGGEWKNVASYFAKSDAGVRKIDISEWAAGHRDVEIRFHYYNSFYEWYWAIDDIYLVGGKGFSCNTAN